MKSLYWLAMAVVGASALAAPSPAARAQDAGDRVVVTLSNGKKFSGSLVSRSEDEVVLRIGDSPIKLPSSMVSSVTRDAAPAPGKTPAASAAAASPAGKSGTAAPAEKGEEPRPGTILLKDGSMVEGFLLKKGDGRIWFVPGKAQAVAAEDVDEIFGDFLEAGGLSISGDAARDSFRLVRELGSGDIARVKAASAALEAYGEGAVPALVKGLRSPDATVRNLCLGSVSARRVEGALDAIMELLRTDPEMGLRATAAESLVPFNRPLVRRALLEAAWRDKDDRVKSAAVRSLQRIATVEEAPALIDLLNILPDGTQAKDAVFAALRTSTGQEIASNGPLWIEWWESGGGKEVIAERIQTAIQARIAEEERKAAQRNGYTGGQTGEGE